MRHLLFKHLTAKAMLIMALHGSVTLDAWTTIRVQNTPTAAHHYIVEDDPLMRPFAKGPALYPAINLLPLPIDLMVIKAHSKKAKIVAYSVAVAAIGLEMVVSARNMNLYNQTQRSYHEQFVCRACSIGGAR